MTRAFVPAAGIDFFLPLYDPLWRLMGGQSVRATFIREAGVAVRWQEGFGDALPYRNATFERVISSFMFHHLDLEVKQGMLAGLLHSHDKIVDNLGGRIRELFEQAGFEDVAELSQGKSLFGRYAHIRGVVRDSGRIVGSPCALPNRC